MGKKATICGLVCILVLGTCSLPFLPITGHVYLKSYENKVKLGSYDIDVRILLSDTSEGQMNIHGYFSYPAAKMLEGGCYVEVSVEIEGQTPQEYPNHVVNTEYEKNFPKENVFSNSIGISSQSNVENNMEKRRLILNLYDEPLTEQVYTINLKPISRKNHDTCSATKTIKHKVKYRRASPFDVAMSV